MLALGKRYVCLLILLATFAASIFLQPLSALAAEDQDFVVRTYKTSDLTEAQLQALATSTLTEEGSFQVLPQINTIAVRDYLVGIMKFERKLFETKVKQSNRRQVMILGRIENEATGAVLGTPSFSLMEGSSGNFTRMSKTMVKNAEKKMVPLDHGISINLVPQLLEAGGVEVAMVTDYSVPPAAGEEEVQRDVAEQKITVKPGKENLVRIKNPDSEKEGLIFRFVASIL